MSFLQIIKSLIKQNSKYKSLNRITIKKDNLIHNFQVFQTHKPNYNIIPVLKSNAYGHGLKQVASIVNSISECRLIAVDSYPEYQIVYKQTNKQILVMGETFAGNYKLFDSKRTQFAIWNADTAQVLGSMNKQMGLHIFINTGMNREGVSVSQLPGLLGAIKQYSHLNVIGVMSHLACADEQNHRLNTTQANNFYEAVQIIKSHGYNPEYIHLEATAGMMNDIDIHRICNTGRLGIGLYGIDPLYNNGKLSELGEKLKPAIDVYSTITGVQIIEEDDSVGYAASWNAAEATKVGIFPFGYMEGIDRGVSGKNRCVAIKDHYCPIIGRVSMNYSTADVNSTDCDVGECVHILSSQTEDNNNIYSFYEAIGRIAYEIVKLDTKTKRVII